MGRALTVLIMLIGCIVFSLPAEAQETTYPITMSDVGINDTCISARITDSSHIQSATAKMFFYYSYGGGASRPNRGFTRPIGVTLDAVMDSSGDNFCAVIPDYFPAGTDERGMNEYWIEVRDVDGNIIRSETYKTDWHSTHYVTPEPPQSVNNGPLPPVPTPNNQIIPTPVPQETVSPSVAPTASSASSPASKGSGLVSDILGNACLLLTIIIVGIGGVGYLLGMRVRFFQPNNEIYKTFGAGMTLFNRGMYSQAIFYADQAIRLDNRFVPAWHLKSFALGMQKQYEEALKVNETALKLDPAFMPAWFLRGTMLCELKRFDEGVTCYDRVIEAGPYNRTRWGVFNEPGMARSRYSDSLFGRAQALHDAGKQEDAENAYRKAIAFDPKNPLASMFTKK
jgi:hypothetical protein